MTDRLKFYFNLQLKMIARQFREYGIQPLPGVIFLFVLFIGISVLMFEKLTFAANVYPLIPIIAVVRLNEPERDLFLRHCFSAQQYRGLRMLENGIIALPFAVFLSIMGELLIASGLIVSSIILSQFALETESNRSLPTPFFKRPFEFLVGFRKTYWLLVTCYGLITAAAFANIPNIALGLLASLFLICFSFYSTQEDPYYVWIFGNTPRRFLWRKATTALLQCSIICLPAALLLCAVFPGSWWIMLWILVAGYLALLTTLFAKYARYPNPRSVEQGILIAFCYWFPPALILLIIVFYTQSLKRLKDLFHDNN